MHERKISGRALAAVGVGTGLLGLLLANGVRVDRETNRRAADLLSTARRAGRPSARTDPSGLPAPVRRYFEAVLPDDRPPVRTVRVRQRGRLRAGDSTSRWRTFDATHHVSASPPGFLWDASVRVAPGCSLRVVDAYERGEGSAEIRLCSLPLGGAGAGPELNEAELVRFLAEAVWYPTALLGENVEWEPRDASAAEVTMTHRGASASLVFHFGDDGLVTRVATDRRYRSVAGGYEPTPWTGHWRDYRTVDGVRVPTAGEVVWHPPEGAFSAWRGRVTSLTYDVEA